MAVSSVEEAKDLLYGEDQDSFVSARDALVKELRQAKERDLATEVKALRKPSAVAAEVNRVVRSDPGGVELILQAAELLRAAQSGELGDVGATMGELQTQYRAAIKALAQTAENRRAEVRAALEAATIDVASNDALRSGSLVVVPEPVSIFGVAPAAPVDELAVRRARRQGTKAVDADEGKALQDEPAPATRDTAKADQEAAAEEEAAAAAAAKVEKKAAATAAAVEADKAAAAAAAAAKAEKKAKRERAQQQAERKKRLKDLGKQHRQALRSHLDALDGEAEAEAALEVAETGVLEREAEIVETQDRIAELQAVLGDFKEQQVQAVTEREAAREARASATERAAQAEHAVQQLAEALEHLEVEMAAGEDETDA